MEKSGSERNNLDDGNLKESEEKLDNSTYQKPIEDSVEEPDMDLEAITKPAVESLASDSISESLDLAENLSEGDSQNDSVAQSEGVIATLDNQKEDKDIHVKINPEGEKDLQESELKKVDNASNLKESGEKSTKEEVNELEDPGLDNTNDEESSSDATKEELAKDNTNSETENPSQALENEVAIVYKQNGDEDSTEQAEDEQVEAHLDYSNYTKKQMVQVLESLLKEDDFSQVGRILKEIKKPYDVITAEERRLAYSRYIEDGGEKDGFEYRADELDQRYNHAFNKLRERKNQYYNSLEKQKDQNLNLKQEILEKIREIVDSEETGSSIKELKDLQKQWKEVGVIPSSQVKSLWANYNALLDRFYDQRSIYFELKELDRKKNYELKIELCVKAEQLNDQDNIREVIKQLNEFHEEFKHIGPVPKEDQETVWERFKAASDQIYSKRKDYYEKLKGELKLNEVAKEALIEKVIPLAEFDSDRISDWNSKTKEIIAIQKEWELVGSLPKEKAKSINKRFWTSFKSFFNKKGHFFKKIEEERKNNLKLKQELVEKAESLKESEDFRKTSDELKRLQQKWKDIGPVPEKFRNEVFIQFKKACDHFFDRRRANSGKIEKDYEDNLKKKEHLCDELEKMLKDDKLSIEGIRAIEAKWGKIGFVPKSNIKSIQNRYSEIIGKIADKVDMPEAEKHKMRFSAQFSNINYGPGAEKMIHKKEGALRRQISTLENDINLWRNNMDFFASSKNADKLKEEFQVKIDKASAQLTNLKEQLKVISNI